MVCDAPGVEEILPKFLSFCEGCVLVAHNASFDTSFIRYNAEQLGIEFPPTYVDTRGNHANAYVSHHIACSE